MKKEIEESICCDIFDAGMALGDIRSKLDALIEVHGEKAILDLDSGYNSLSVSLITTRLETESEYLLRFKKEEKIKEKERERDLMNAKRLAEKHGAKVV